MWPYAWFSPLCPLCNEIEHKSALCPKKNTKSTAKDKGKGVLQDPKSNFKKNKSVGNSVQTPQGNDANVSIHSKEEKLMSSCK
ncbi:hypothetical protein Bca4012_056433 [Brassica carinata]|uniref:Uncharacterized protein n=1 Tax=Brassica carinata TaxID=52824 RepID=A0A8X8B3R4_BRACI|nr:hypothetical protein Bca52824_013740 [Brassica carinata]